jgi:DNA polymerase III subunit delta'
MSSELELVGHEAARRALRAALRRGSLPHALIFSGPSGIGKRRLAQWLIAARWCAEPEPPCGRCSSCRKVAGGQHPDVELVSRNPGKERDPEELGSRTEITVDQVRRGLLPALSLHSVEGQGRAALIDDADTLNEAAQNALLKTLEEPPPGCLLMLICAHEDALLDTVRSRCQVVRLSPLDDAEMERLFPGEDRELLRLARGRPGRLAELSGIDASALGALLRDVLSGALPGSAFGRAVQDVVAHHVESGADEPRAMTGGEAERDAESSHRLVAELLLAHWRELLTGPVPPPAADPPSVQDALLELGSDLGRHIPAAVAWTAAGLALARAHSIAHLVPERPSAPYA